MSTADCYICGEEIPVGVSFYGIMRTIHRKATSAFCDDEIQYKPIPPVVVLVGCLSCVTRVLDGEAPFPNCPYQLLDLEMERLYESCMAVVHGSRKIARAKSCSICHKSVKKGSLYMQSSISEEMIDPAGCINQGRTITIGIICCDCIMSPNL